MLSASVFIFITLLRLEMFAGKCIFFARKQTEDGTMCLESAVGPLLRFRVLFLCAIAQCLRYTVNSHYTG